jgi:hypothetical protein
MGGRKAKLVLLLRVISARAPATRWLMISVMSATLQARGKISVEYFSLWLVLLLLL